MADFLKILDGETLANITVQFDYKNAISEFRGLKLMPMVKTPNMKVAIHNLLKGSDVPVIALVHALDAEARIADRPVYEAFAEQMFLLRVKLNQGEELRKKIRDMGMDSSERSILEAIYDDISNLIVQILTGFERRACEALSTAKLVIEENGAERVVDYKLSADNKIPFNGWSTPSHDIIADLAALKVASNNAIVRQIVSSKILDYMLANEKLNAFAQAQLLPMTQSFVTNYISNALGIEIIVDDRTFKKSHLDTTKYRFFDEDTVISLTTRGEVGKTFVTSTPAEDANAVNGTYGYVTVSQYKSVGEPWTTWTEAEGMGLPVFADINNTLYLSKVTA